MKIALFSPLPPKKTGIANYSVQLASALRARADVELFDSRVSMDELDGMPVHDIGAYPEIVLDLDRCDACMYHLGNSPWYHLDIYRALLRRPGVVVLHDAVLYYLIAGQGPGGLLKELCTNYGTERIDEYRALLDACPEGNVLRYPHPERYPLLARTMSAATSIIVHSATSREKLRSLGYTRPINVIPLLSYAENPKRIDPSKVERFREEHRIPRDALVIGNLGFLGPTKRMNAVFAALSKLVAHFDFRFLIVGEGMELEGQIEAFDLGDRVIATGFVNDDEFDHYLALSDVIVNLRYPSMGEASATLVQAMTFAKPCIVTDHAWFAELPHHVVKKIGFGASEITELTAAFIELGASADARDALGRAGHAYVSTVCSPDSVAELYIEALRDAGGSNPTA